MFYWVPAKTIRFQLSVGALHKQRKMKHDSHHPEPQPVARPFVREEHVMRAVVRVLGPIGRPLIKVKLQHLFTTKMPTDQTTEHD